MHRSLHLLLSLLLVVGFTGCDLASLFNDDDDDDEELSMTCEGRVSFEISSIGSSGGVSELSEVEVGGYGLVHRVRMGERLIEHIPVTKGQVLNVTWRFTGVFSQSHYNVNPIFLVVAGNAEDFYHQLGPEEFTRFTETMRAGETVTFTYTVTVPDFQEILGHGPCIP